MSLFNAKADIGANDIVICKDGEASVSAARGFNINSCHQFVAKRHLEEHSNTSHKALCISHVIVTLVLM